MAIDLAAVKTAAAVVKAEVAAGANSATRIGALFENVVAGIAGEFQAEQSADFTAVKGGIYPVNCTAGVITVTPPASPVLDDWFAINDSRGNSATNNIIVDFTTAGQNLHGSVQNYVSNANRDSRVFRFSGATLGWVCE